MKDPGIMEVMRAHFAIDRSSGAIGGRMVGPWVGAHVAVAPAGCDPKRLPNGALKVSNTLLNICSRAATLAGVKWRLELFSVSQVV